MEEYIKDFSAKIETALKNLPVKEIAKALNILQAVYERDGRIYIIGNGGSLAIARHFVGDLNKTVFSSHLNKKTKRFQAIALPTTDSELTAWANDIGYDMILAPARKGHFFVSKYNTTNGNSQHRYHSSCGSWEINVS